MSKIAIDYTPAYEQGGGIGRYVREITAALASYDIKTDYRLFVSGAASTQLPKPIGDNFQWRPTRLTPRWLARIWHRAKLPLPVEVFTGRVDLYHATDFVLPPTLPGTKTLLTVHDLSFIRVPETASPSLRVYLERVVPRSAYQADHILADSEATKRDLIEIYSLLPEKITVLLSGVDSRFAPVRDSGGILTTRSLYKINERPYILSLGTVQPRKNYSRLVQALANLRQTGHDIGLVIVGGRGWLEDTIYDTIRTTKMEEFVCFTGFADENDLPALYSGAVCFAFPSLYEGFGIPILEAMACGTPVVTSNVSSLPEVTGEAGLMVNPYDVDELTESLRRLIVSSELRADLIQRGFEQARRFTWSQSARHLYEIYQRMLN